MKRLVLALAFALSSMLAACTPEVVQRLETRPVVADASWATILFVHPPRTAAGPVWIADAPWGAPPTILGALESRSHFVARVRPGRHMLVGYDDRSYDGLTGDLAPGAIYVVEAYDSGSSELTMRPIASDGEYVPRLLDETDNVELARPPRASDKETMQKKVQLARFRVSQYSGGAARSHQLLPTQPPR